MESRTFKIPSSRGDESLRCAAWTPKNPIASLQIVHGMCEHIMRYSDFATHLAGVRVTILATAARQRRRGSLPRKMGTPYSC